MFLPAVILKSYFPFNSFFYSITIQFDTALLQLYPNQFRKPILEIIGLQFLILNNLNEDYMSQHIHYVTDANFDAEVLQSTTPVLVDYWAEWCGPCKMIAPILDEIASEYGERLKVAKLNIDENQQTPPKYGIRGIPTLMLFKNGNIEATKVGALSKSQLTAFIDSHI